MVETEVIAAPSEKSDSGRDESETAWRLRHLKRSILKEAPSSPRSCERKRRLVRHRLAATPRPRGRIVGAGRLALHAFAAAGPGQPADDRRVRQSAELLQLDRTSSVAFFSVGAPVGAHGDWNVHAAMNQSDLSSWMLAGNYVTATARRRIAISSACRTACSATKAATRRAGGAVRHGAQRRLRVRLRRVGDHRPPDVGYGAHYAHYDYLSRAGDIQPALQRDASPLNRLAPSRGRDAPRQRAGRGGIHSAGAAQVLPPQRTFSPLSSRGFRAEDLQNYEVGVERVLNGATIAVRAFEQHIDDQTVTVFGLRVPAIAVRRLGHYYVGSAGDVDLRGWGVNFHARARRQRSRLVRLLDGDADWTNQRRSIAAVSRAACPRRSAPTEHIHDFTTSLETEIPHTAHSRFRALQVEQRVHPRRRLRVASRASTAASTCRSTRGFRS